MKTETLSAAESDRAWPLPRRSWSMRMEWRNLLFMHFPVPVAALADLIPGPLELQTYDGTAWIGIVPFEMTGIRARGLPPIPGTSAFPELNLRTYVTNNDKPGVWFFSLDAAHRMAVWTARRFFHLPYFNADISVACREDHVSFHSCRTHRDAAPATFDATYGPIGESFRAAGGTFEHWLTARYCLYSASDSGRVYRGEIDHDPWPLQRAECDLRQCALTDWLGFPIPDGPPILHFAKYIDVHAWTIRRIAS